MAEGRPADLLAAARAAPGNAEAAARILPLVDLTALGDDDTPATTEALCARAIETGVAAGCVWPRFLPLAKKRLEGSPVHLVSVANFPDGSDDIARAAKETGAAIAAGADEVDVVAPIQAVLDGDVGLVTELVQACRAACGEGTLKVVLETGRLEDLAMITAAARAAIMAGCDFLETSTGAFRVGATLEAAAVLLAVLEEAGGRVGLKLSGGIRTTAQAAAYLSLVDHFMGSGWTRPETLRFGASNLADDLLRVLAPDR
jgi:deoxyribose-phosphate aldolase